MTDLLNGIAGVSHVGVIRVAGEDAGAFLHSQLTQDFSSLDMRQARLAAFLSAKGRMQASFIGLRRPDEWLLLCSRDLLPATLARLSMFVLRAKARLTDASADFALYGLAGETLTAVGGGARPAWGKAGLGTASLVRLFPAADQPLPLLVGVGGRDLEGGGGRRAARLEQGPHRHLQPGAPVPRGKPAPRAVGGTGRRPATGRPLARHPAVAVERGGERRGHAEQPRGAGLRAADAQLRVRGRRELQERLLPRARGGGAQPVPRHAQAPRLYRPCRGRYPRRPRSLSSPPPPATLRHPP